MRDFILNGAAHGDVASVLLKHNFDVGALRPFEGLDGAPYITKNVNGTNETIMVLNAPASLRFNEWRLIDEAVTDAVYTTPQRMWGDLRASGNAVIIPNGMGKTVYEYQRASDIGPATTSMDGIRESDQDRQLFDLTGIPLPIVHKDFQYTAREIAVSRNNGPSLDTSNARLAARKCLEEVEKYTAGTQTFAAGGYSIYGYCNFPQRMTQSLTAPSSVNHPTTIAELLSMKKKLMDKGFQGPYVVYTSPAWEQYMDEDYINTGVRSDTFRARIMQIEGISAVRNSYWLTGNTVLMVQMQPETCRPVVGMEVVTVQWPTHGGMLLNYKVMCILIPLMKADFNGISGIVHGS